ncbi:hypothetical protein LguiA_012994 [Lonicera macranthoides]
MASKYDPQEQPLPEEKRCAVEEVALVVPETDDPSLPVMTFRAWFLGLTSCVILVFLNTFFKYRTQPLTISAVIMQIAVLPVGKFMAATLPEREYSVLGCSFSLNPGPFNIKEHVLGYGWAGMFRRYLVDPVEMWWPANLTQVSLFRIQHICTITRLDFDDLDPQNFLWQSYDYPTDMLLPGMKLKWDRKTKLNWYLSSWKSEDDPSSGNYFSILYFFTTTTFEYDEEG